MTDGTAELRRMSTEQKRKFLREYCDGRIFTSLELEDQSHLLHLVFLPLALADRDALPDLSKLGLIWEHTSAAGPRSVNGMPIFFSCHFMHLDDWTELRPKIAEELERRERATEDAIP